MPIPQFTTEQLYLTVDQLVRRAGGPGAADPRAIARYLYDHAREDTRGTLAEYRKIAGDAIRMSQAAFTAELTPEIRQRVLPKVAGISQGDPTYAFRVVVVARDNDGNELFSTAVWVRSDNELNALQIKLAAVQAVAPAPREYQQAVHGKVIASYDTYIMLAGMHS